MAGHGWTSPTQTGPTWIDISMPSRHFHGFLGQGMLSYDFLVCSIQSTKCFYDLEHESFRSMELKWSQREDSNNLTINKHCVAKKCIEVPVATAGDIRSAKSELPTRPEWSRCPAFTFSSLTSSGSRLALEEHLCNTPPGPNKSNTIPRHHKHT